MLVMVVFFIAFRWIHLSTPLIRLFLLVLILLLMRTLSFLLVWFALSFLRFRLSSRLPMMFSLCMVAIVVFIIPSRTVLLLTSLPLRRAIMFMLVSWFGLTLPLLNAADWFLRSVEHDQKTGLTTFGQFHQHHSQMPRD